MKYLISTALFIFSACVAFSQTLQMNFIPDKGEAISATDYNKGKHILSNSYQAIEESSNGVCYADLWNVAIGLAYVGGDMETIYQLLIESKFMSPASFCEVAQYQLKSSKKKLEDTKFYKLLDERYRTLLADCSSYKDIEEDSTYNTKIDMDLTMLNEGLIDQLIVMMEKDQRHRNIAGDYEANWASQNALDKENQIELTQLFETIGYPGKMLVGERFMNHACIIFEHGGELAYQEKYFPLVIKAMHQGDVIKPVVRMLVDRIHWKKTKKQIFGSHIGVPFDSDEIIDQIKKQYGL